MYTGVQDGGLEAAVPQKFDIFGNHALMFWKQWCAPTHVGSIPVRHLLPLPLTKITNAKFDDFRPVARQSIFPLFDQSHDSLFLQSDIGALD